ncbi:MAG: hypothetical protein CMJ84_02885 [Planctomycetes bacterium]|jgi:hypothetical protein|nr:hypothetical protein [Planctomycetota bacterium]MDP6408053.1 hypothetical protein [Planctomycetota bacterium]
MKPLSLTRRLLAGALTLLVTAQPVLLTAHAASGEGTSCPQTCCCSAAGAEEAGSGGCCDGDGPSSPTPALLTRACPCKATAPGEPTPTSAPSAATSPGSVELREYLERHARASADFEAFAVAERVVPPPPPRRPRAARGGGRRSLHLLERGIDTLLAAFGTSLR